MSTLLAERPAPHFAARPSLESGDHLAAAEFHRRYLERPDLPKTELIAGVVYVASPVRIPHHGIPHVLVTTEFGIYQKSRRGVRVSSEGTLKQDSDDEVRPDLMAYRASGGNAWLDAEGYLHGAPELIAEISASSVSYDLHEKKDLYRRIGVREYIVWRVSDEAIDWWQLIDGEYFPISPDASGVIHSVAFEGLQLDVPELLAMAREAMQDIPG